MIQILGLDLKARRNTYGCEEPLNFISHFLSYESSVQMFHSAG